MDLNVPWQRKFLRDGNAYGSFSTFPTADGGCIVVGTVYDLSPEDRFDVFVSAKSGIIMFGISKFLLFLPSDK